MSVLTSLAESAARRFGADGLFWLQEESLAKPAIVLMGLWSAGSSMVIWLAGLKSVPKQLYEAAEIDGAGRIARFIRITLPMLTPYIFFNLVMGIIGAFQIFTQAYVMTEGGPADSTLFYVYYLFNNAFRYFRMGYASAMAWDPVRHYSHFDAHSVQARPALGSLRIERLFMNRARLKRAAQHAVLIFGSVLFALPFIWLVSTSLKWDRELFMEPSSWFDRLRPRLPYRVLRTPYIAERDTLPFQKPSSMDERKWQALRGSLESLLWEEAQQVLTRRDYPDAARNALRTHIARDLWRQIAAEKPKALWNESEERIKAEIANSVSYEKIESAWNRLYRSIRLGTPSVQSIDRSEYKAEDGKWSASRGGSLISPRETLRSAQEIWTDYQRAPAPPYASYYAYEIDSPVQSSDLRAVIVPIRADESYHHFTAEVVAGGETYVSKKPFILQNYGWNETLFQLRGEPSDREAIPLEKTDRASSVGKSGRAKIVLTLHRAPYLLAAFRKFSRNYSEAASFVSFWRYVLNTAIVTALSVAAQLLSCSLAAYAFARLRWPGRDKLFFLLICTMMLPPQVTMVPLFILARNLGCTTRCIRCGVLRCLGARFLFF